MLGNILELNGIDTLSLRTIYDDGYERKLVSNKITTFTASDIVNFTRSLVVDQDVKRLVDYIIYDNYGNLNVMDSFYYLLYDLPGLYISDNFYNGDGKVSYVSLTTSCHYYRGITPHYWESENLYFISDELFNIAYEENFPDTSFNSYIWNTHGEPMISLVSKSIMVLINRILGTHLSDVEDNLSVEFLLFSRDGMMTMGPIYEVV